MAAPSLIQQATQRTAATPPDTAGHHQLTQCFYEGFPYAYFAVEDAMAQGDWV